MVKAYLNKKVKLDEFITHKMTLDQVNDAIELMKHGKWYILSQLLLTRCKNEKLIGASLLICALHLFPSIRTVLSVSPQ